MYWRGIFPGVKCEWRVRYGVFFSSWQMWSLYPVLESWCGYEGETESITWLWHTGFSFPSVLPSRLYRKMTYTDKCTHAQTWMSLAHLLTVCFFDSSSQIFLNWRKTRKFLPPCQISCLSWNTLIRWTPGSRRPGRAETSSMHFTEAAWRISTPLFTTGCTVTSTRLVRLVLRHALWQQREVHITCSIPHTFGMTLTALLVTLFPPVDPCFQHACCVQNSVFGEGTYLTSDLSMALLYSPHSSGWQESLLGPLLSCVALCEVIDHPDVKCQVKKKGAAPRSRTPEIKILKWKPDSRWTFSRFRSCRPSALESKEQRRRRSSTQVLCSHQQSAFESEIPTPLLSEEAPVQVKIPQLNSSLITGFSSRH